jgi:predicted DNA-binding transcriptional regulator AlpA
MTIKNSALHSDSAQKLGFYSLQQILELYPVSRATLYREIRDRRFPAQVRITRNRVGWPRATVDRFLAKQAGIAAA